MLYRIRRETGLSAVSFILICLFVPPHVKPLRWKDIRSTLKTFDGLGILSGIGFVVPLLILTCQVSTLKNRLPVLIALAVITPVFFSIFLALGFCKRNVRPVVPFMLFGNQTIAAILVQNVLFGAVYYGFIYFVPLYLQVVRELDLVKGSALFVSYFATHAIWSTISGLIVSALQNKGQKSYSYILTFGFIVWTLAMGLLGWQSKAIHSSLAPTVGFQILVGLGTGSVLQNSIMAIRSQVTSEHNAVAVSTRNVLRFFGGALGIAIFSVVLEEVLATLLLCKVKRF